MRNRKPIEAYLPLSIRVLGRASAFVASTIVIANAISIVLPVSDFPGSALVLNPIVAIIALAALTFMLGVWAGSGGLSIFERTEEWVEEERSLGRDMLELSRSAPSLHFSPERWMPRYLVDAQVLLARAQALGLRTPSEVSVVNATQQERFLWIDRYFRAVGPLLAVAEMSKASNAALRTSEGIFWDEEETSLSAD